MMMIPVQFKKDQLTVFIIFEDENIDRIKHYDPAVLEWDKIPEAVRNTPVHEIHMCYASNAEARAIEDAGQRGNFKAMMTLVRGLGRNFRFRPEAGDHDGPYRSIKPPEESFGE